VLAQGPKDVAKTSPGSSSSGALGSSDGSINTSSTKALMDHTFHIGQSHMDHEMFKEFMQDKLLDTDNQGHWRAPGDKKVPKPRAYEAFGFRDFFKSGLQFPSKEFVGAVLAKFKVQMYQWTPKRFCSFKRVCYGLEDGWVCAKR
jgi:hypothetical protein